MARVKAIVPGIQVGRRFLTVGEEFDVEHVAPPEEQVRKFGRVLYVPVTGSEKPVGAAEEKDKRKDAQAEEKPARRAKRRS